MTPVYHRIPDCTRQCFGKFLEFFPVISVTGDKMLIDSVGTHQPPFIMVAAEPKLGDILKTAVFPDFLGIDMTVIINNRHIFGVFMIQPLGSRRVQQKIPV